VSAGATATVVVAVAATMVAGPAVALANVTASNLASIVTVIQTTALSTAQLAAEFKKAGLNAEQTARAFIQAGTPAIDIAAVLKDLYSLDQDGMVEVLRAANLGWPAVFEILSEVYGQTLPELVAMVHKHKVSFTDVLSILSAATDNVASHVDKALGLKNAGVLRPRWRSFYGRVWAWVRVQPPARCAPPSWIRSSLPLPCAPQVSSTQPKSPARCVTRASTRRKHTRSCSRRSPCRWRRCSRSFRVCSNECRTMSSTPSTGQSRRWGGQSTSEPPASSITVTTVLPLGRVMLETVRSCRISEPSRMISTKSSPTNVAGSRSHVPSPNQERVVGQHRD